MKYVNKTLFYSYYRWLQRLSSTALQTAFEFLEVMALPHNLIRPPQSLAGLPNEVGQQFEERYGQDWYAADRGGLTGLPLEIPTLDEVG